MAFLLSPSLLVSSFLKHRVTGSLGARPLAPPRLPSGCQQLRWPESGRPRVLLVSCWLGLGDLSAQAPGEPSSCLEEVWSDSFLASKSPEGVTTRHPPRDFSGAAARGARSTKQPSCLRCRCARQPPAPRGPGRTLQRLLGRHDGALGWAGGRRPLSSFVKSHR